MSYVIAGAACLVCAAAGFVTAAVMAAGQVKPITRIDDDSFTWANDTWFDAEFAQITAQLEDQPYDQEAE